MICPYKTQERPTYFDLGLICCDRVFLIKRPIISTTFTRFGCLYPPIIAESLKILIFNFNAYILW